MKFSSSGSTPITMPSLELGQTGAALLMLVSMPPEELVLELDDELLELDELLLEEELLDGIPSGLHSMPFNQNFSGTSAGGLVLLP